MFTFLTNLHIKNKNYTFSNNTLNIFMNIIEDHMLAFIITADFSACAHLMQPWCNDISFKLEKNANFYK